MILHCSFVSWAIWRLFSTLDGLWPIFKTRPYYEPSWIAFGPGSI
jgi:hypothetical protein